jgi:hypothetical protein
MLRINLLLSFLLLSYIGTFGQNATKVKDIKTNIYAGIEVGSKGVKMSILELTKNAKQINAFKIIKDSSVNSDFISFNTASYAATLNGLQGMYNFALNKYNLSSNKIYTVISSGVKGQADKDNKTEWIKKLIDSFKLKIKEPNREVAIIDVSEEAKLSHLGIVPEDRRFTTFLIDIGSGNTKGGYFPNGNTSTFKLFNVNWGTKSVTNESDKRCLEDKSLINYNKNLKRVILGAVGDEITYAVNASNAFAMNDYVAISGGISWAVATLMYPELGTNTVIPVTYDDVLFFLNKITSTTRPYEPESVEKLLLDTDPNKPIILNEVKKVHKAFDQKSLLGGASLLLKIMRQFSGIQEKKLFYLVRNGQVGWITAYVEMYNK